MTQWEKALEKPLDELLKDRDALALRNRTLADAYHQAPMKHHIRRVLLRALATIYVPSRHTPRDKRRILLIRPDHLGDVLLTTPAIQMLRAIYPHAEIHVLVGPWAASILDNLSDIDLVLTIPFPGFTRSEKLAASQPYTFAVQTARRLRRIGYTDAIIFRPDHWWGAWVAKMAGIPVRIGYNQVDVTYFLTHRIHFEHTHAVVQSLRLVEALTHRQIKSDDVRLDFVTTASQEAFVAGYLAEWNVPDSKAIFCIHPGSGTKVKQWLPSKWAEVADVLSKQFRAQVVFTGGDHELSLIQDIIMKMTAPAIIMAGNTDIGHVAALYKRAKLVLGPDSGPLHLAAAVGTPTVTLYGPADPIEFGTWGDPAYHHQLTTEITCRPCRVLDWSHDDLKYHPCVRDIRVADVLSAAYKAVAES